MKKIKRTMALIGLLSFGLTGIELSGKEGGFLKSWCKQGKGLALASAGLCGMLFYGGGLVKCLKHEDFCKCNTLRLSMKLFLSTYGAMEGVEMVYDSSLMACLKARLNRFF